MCILDEVIWADIFTTLFDENDVSKRCQFRIYNALIVSRMSSPGDPQDDRPRDIQSWSPSVLQLPQSCKRPQFSELGRVSSFVTENSDRNRNHVHRRSRWLRATGSSPVDPGPFPWPIPFPWTESKNNHFPSMLLKTWPDQWAAAWPLSSATCPRCPAWRPTSLPGSLCYGKCGLSSRGSSAPSPASPPPLPAPWRSVCCPGPGTPSRTPGGPPGGETDHSRTWTAPCTRPGWPIVSVYVRLDLMQLWRSVTPVSFFLKALLRQMK